MKDYEVVIDGTSKEVDHTTLTYDEVGELAYPGHPADVKFAITYRDATGPRGGNGILVEGESVKIKKKGTSFDVRLANRS
jgi:hypothetical protein